MLQVRAPFHVLKALAAIAPKKDIRYYLMGVQIQTGPRETILTATDGHILVVHRYELAKGDADQPSVEFILPADPLRAIKLSAQERRANLSEVVIEIHQAPGTSPSGGQKTCATLKLSLGATMGFECIDENFPDWRKVVPSKVSGALAQFNPANVLAVSDCISKCEQSTGTLGDCLQHNGEAGAVIVRGNTVGVIMPWRSEDAPKAIPNWVHTVPRATKAELKVA